jgi:hypothetical protein
MAAEKDNMGTQGVEAVENQQGAMVSGSQADYKAFRAAKARRKEVEAAKNIVYGELTEIIKGVVKEAKEGNYNAAKFLLLFAGVIEAAPAAKAAQPRKAEKAQAVPVLEVAAKSPEEGVASFFEKLGVTPPMLLPPKPATEQGLWESTGLEMAGGAVEELPAGVSCGMG